MLLTFVTMAYSESKIGSDSGSNIMTEVIENKSDSIEVGSTSEELHTETINAVSETDADSSVTMVGESTASKDSAVIDPYNDLPEFAELNDWLEIKRKKSKYESDYKYKKKIQNRYKPYGFKINVGLSFMTQEYSYKTTENKSREINMYSEDSVTTFKPDFGIEIGFHNGIYFNYSFLNVSIDKVDESYADRVEFDYFDVGYIRKIHLGKFHYVRLMLGPSLLKIKTIESEGSGHEGTYFGISNGVGYETNIMKRFSFYSDLNFKFHRAQYNNRDYHPFFYGVSVGIHLILGSLPE